MKPTMNPDRYLFRGKRLDNGQWVYGDLEYNRAKDIARIHSYDTDGNYIGQNEVDPETVGQSTGLQDRNKSDIFEGDIIEIFCCLRDYVSETTRKIERRVFEVAFHRGAFIADGWTYLPCLGYESRHSVTISNYDHTEEELCKKEIAHSWNRERYGDLTLEHFKLPSVIGNIHDNPELIKE